MSPARPPSRNRTLLAAVGLLLILIGLVVVFSGQLNKGAAGPTDTDPSTVTSKSTTSKSSKDQGAIDSVSGLRWIEVDQLPPEAHRTLELIDSGGPFPYSKDGVTFGNRERILPKRAGGYYREYTVKTPGEGDRGARRIVTGNDDQEFYYTADHYDSFKRIRR